MEQGWKEYFVFTHRERLAVIVLVISMIVMWSLHRMFPPARKKLEISWVKLEKQEDGETGRRGEGETGRLGDVETGRLGDVETWRRGDVEKGKSAGPKFYFDPNSISGEEWMRLGLREKQARIIRNYVTKGGRFRKPEDLLKIYGMDPGLVQELVPFVRIKESLNSAEAGSGTGTNRWKNGKDSTAEWNLPKNNRQTFERKQGNIEKIEVNTCSVDDLDKLPGIGLKLGERIIKFREALGGFISVEQVKETFGLQDSVYQKIRPYLFCNGSVKQIDINTADQKLISSHPYLRGTIGFAIVNYRKEHGPFQTAESLQAIPAITPDVYKKLRPYLSVGEKINLKN